MFKKKTIFECEYYELEKFVKEKYGVDYDFVANEECGNDSSHTFTVDGEVDEDFDIHVVSYRNYDLMNKLCKDGHIEPGEYLINVCW